MNIFYEGNILLIRPEGRIDSGNAAEVEREIFNEVNKHEPKYIVIDAEKLEYISSAGLRVILKLKKTVDSTQIVNASTEVYDIFSMTGFTELITVRKAFRTISVDGCKVLGKGAVGTTYKLNDDTIVKLYNHGISFEDIIREKESAKAAFVSGVPTAIPFDTVKCGEQYGTVYELINARPPGDVMAQDLGNMDKYARKAADLLSLLGTTHGGTGKFFSYAEVSHKNAEILNKAVSGGLFTAEEMEKIHKLYDTVPERDTLIHGDFHTHNIFISNGELQLIDMADTSTGHPIFELGNMYLPFIYLSKMGDERTVPLIGLDSKTAVTFFRKVLGMYLDGFGEEDMSILMDVLRIISHIRMMYMALAPLQALPEEQRNHIYMGYKNELKEMYFDRSDEVQSLLSNITSKF